MTFDNFIIRQIARNDSEAYFSLVDNNRDRISKYFPITAKANQDIESTRVHIENRIALAERKEFITYIVVDKTNNQIAGSIFLKDIDWNIPKSEIGFYIDKQYTGKGIMTKVVAHITDHCFQSMKMQKVFMRIAEDNIASRRVAEKNNFDVEGILRKDFKTFEGELIDVMYYGRLRLTS